MTALSTRGVVEPLGSTHTHLVGKVNESMRYNFVTSKEVGGHPFITTRGSVRRLVCRWVYLPPVWYSAVLCGGFALVVAQRGVDSVPPLDILKPRQCSEKDFSQGVKYVTLFFHCERSKSSRTVTYSLQACDSLHNGCTVTRIQQHRLRSKSVW